MTIGIDETIPERHFAGGANLTGDQPEDLAPMLEVMRGKLAIAGATTEDLTYYVSPTGDDEEGDGSEGSPFLTPTRALQNLPSTIKHKVTINLAAGTYTDFPQYLIWKIEDEGQLVIQGTGNPTTVAGPFALTGYALDPNWIYSTFTVGGAAWAVDQFYGKFIRMTSGAAAGRIFPVYKNTATQIITAAVFPWVASISPGDNFEIVDPPAVVSIDHDINFVQLNAVEVTAPGAPIWSPGRSGLFGIRFVTSATYTLHPFTFVGTDTMCLFTAFQIPGGLSNVDALYLKNGTINWNGLIDSSVMYDATLLSGMWNTQIVIGSVPLSGVGFLYTGAQMENAKWDGLTCRATVQLRGICDLRDPAAASANCWLGSIVTLNNAYLDDCGMGGAIDGVWVNENASLYMFGAHIESVAGQDGIQLSPNSRASLGYVVGNAANISAYGVRLDAICTVVNLGGTTISGVTNDIYFNLSATAFAWPLSGASVTDGVGSLVTSA